MSSSNVFAKVTMVDLKKFVETPEPLKGIRCQLGVTGPQFFEGKAGIRSKKSKVKGNGSNK